MNTRLRLCSSALLATVALLGCRGDSTDVPALADDACAAGAQAAVQTCLLDYSDAAAACLSADDALCGAGSAGPDSALDALADSVAGACGDAGLFGLDADATVARLQTACASEADSLAWRSFGGPQAAVWVDAPDTRACLTAAHDASVGLVADHLGDFAACAGGCDDLAGQRADQSAAATADITAACGDTADIIAVGPEGLAERAALQADCLAAATIEDAGALDLACGPDFAAIDAPRGEWTQVPVDPDEWGAICGDGSDYSFWLRPAPEGAPLDRVFVGLQGGGVCVFEDDCTAKLAAAPGLFTAEDDAPIPVGLVSDDPAVTIFADWTQVYLPYCNQDVFAGGGAVEQLGDLTLPRAGAVNLRSALRMTRDYLWRELDAEGGDGFRPDQVVAAFGGWSAGAYGTLYNYHWVLDDLQWPRTVAFPDAGLGLDSGETLGVKALGAVKIPLWGTLPNLPPYCFDGDCAVGPILLEALSPRLQTVPEQQVLVFSNQRDETQRADAYFSEEVNFINTLRADYCSTKELPGVHWYLTSVSEESVHVVTVRDEHWLGTVDGVAMNDWFRAAIEAPDTLTSHAEEADFVDVIPGVEPFPCAVAP
jgi:hypothetical protein